MVETLALIAAVLALGVASLTAVYVWQQANAAVDSAGYEARQAEAAQEAVSYSGMRSNAGVSRCLQARRQAPIVLCNEGTHSAYVVTVDLGELEDEPTSSAAAASSAHS